jgi:hypothetical protein
VAKQNIHPRVFRTIGKFRHEITLTSVRRIPRIEVEGELAHAFLHKVYDPFGWHDAHVFKLGVGLTEDFI